MENFYLVCGNDKLFSYFMKNNVNDITLGHG